MMNNEKLMRRLFFCLLLIFCTQIQAQVLTNYAKKRQKEIAEMQRVEKTNYEKACNKGTIESLKEYLNMYPNGKYVTDIKARISDYDLWNSARKLNTIDAYNNYIQKSQYKSYQKDANDAITELLSVDEWNKVKLKDDVESIEQFLSKYPNSSCLNNARKRRHEVLAVKYATKGEYTKAYNEFSEAGGRYQIDTKNLSLFDKATEYHSYSSLSEYSNEKDLQSFLNDYPNSENFDKVSNWLAIKKAKALTTWSGETSFNDALSFAKDVNTKNIVTDYINRNKKGYKEHLSNTRKYKIKANGGIILFGLELLDFGWNCLSEDKYLEVYYYNVGASVKLGNYKSPVQLEVGLKLGVICYKIAGDEDYYDNDEEAKFHMPAYVKLKVNICNLGAKKQSKLYICGLGEYNVIHEEYLENEYSVGGGFGMAWRHWDWLTLYYRQDLNNKYKLDDKFLGTSCVYYF